MGSNESRCSKEISCDIPVLSSCYSNPQEKRRKHPITTDNSSFRKSLLVSVVRKAYLKLENLQSEVSSKKLQQSSVLKQSNHHSESFKHSQHLKLYHQQQDQLKLLLNGQDLKQSLQF
jgi:hypothetical protein